MFYSLTGLLVAQDVSGIAVECAGVAYYCQTTISTMMKLGELGSEVKVYTYLNVREGAIDLFAFADREELACFRMLIGVSGVGPKVALAILSQMPPEQLVLSVASGDYKYLTVAQGVGAKLAQRIILELKDKVQAADFSTAGVHASTVRAAASSGNVGEAISALVVLGYSQSEAAAVIGAMPPNTPVEELVKAGLRGLASR